MAEYVTGEEYQAMKKAPHRSAKTSLPRNPIVFIIVAVVLMGLSFYGGIAYQKSKHPAAATAASGNFANGSGGFGGGGGRFSGQRPTIGSVTAISATSITVQDSRTGSSVTLSITSSTQITDNGQTVAASDIQTGDTVLVTASTSSSSQASRILVNPSFGGGGGGGSGSGASGTSADPSSNGSDSTVTD